MEEDSVLVMRETSRKILKLNRRFHRDEEADSHRSVAITSETPQRIEDIANQLKTKSSILLADLQTLKNGLIEDRKNIDIVLTTHGALRGLVRELSGNEVNKQCAAAGCCCNLGLADSKGGAAVVKAAGPYLVAALDSFNIELAVTCAWAVGNLAGSGVKACEMLEAQGALAKLSQLLLTTNEELKDAAVYALVHFTWQMKDMLRSKYVKDIINALADTDTSLACCQLLFILSCHPEFCIQEIPNNYLQKLLQDLPSSTQFHISYCQNACLKNCKLLYLIRIFANVKLDEKINSMYTDFFLQITEFIKKIVGKEDSVSRSVLWLLGNMFKYDNGSILFNKLL